MLRERPLREELRELLTEWGIIVNPLKSFDEDLEKLLKGCRSRCSMKIFLFLFNKGPSTYTHIREGVGYSDTSVSYSLRQMQDRRLVSKHEPSLGAREVYDISPRSFRWLRDRKTKPLLMLATV